MSRNKDKHEGASGRTYHIMSEAERASGRRGGWTTLEVTGGVRALAPPLFQLAHLTALYLNDNSLQRIPPDINQLVNLHTLDISSNKLRSLPAELGDLIQLRELHLHNNYLRTLPYELGKLFHLQMMGLQGNPLSKEMLSIYNDNNGTAKLLTYMLDNLQVSATLPPQRPWIPLTRPNRTRPTCIFTVMCYNVLCDKYATRQMYGYCPSWALDWDYRKKGILDEIRHYSADIISLQEVETNQFYNYFLPELKKDGYDGIFSPKSRAKTMSESERKYVDGCAIFFRSAKFSLVKETLIEFNQLAMANSEGSDNMLNRVMPKDNIGLAALLKTKEAAWENVSEGPTNQMIQSGVAGNAASATSAGQTGGTEAVNFFHASAPVGNDTRSNDTIRGIPTDTSMLSQPILVCTAHIHWDPEFCDVKLIQTMMLSNELRAIHEDSTRTLRMSGLRDNVQLLLCGDFNSLPDSGVVEFLSAGRVSADHRDFKELGYAASLRRMLGSEHEFTHNFKLASAYSEDIMPYTNYTFDFKGIIDYIFYSKQTMTPLGLLGPLSQDWFREHKVVGCPHPHIPSDHFPLLVELEMSPGTGNSNGLIGRR